MSEKIDPEKFFVGKKAFQLQRVRESVDALKNRFSHPEKLMVFRDSYGGESLILVRDLDYFTLRDKITVQVLAEHGVDGTKSTNEIPREKIALLNDKIVKRLKEQL